ncbi:glycosyltransferase family 4 protein [Sinorhizobium numidicum]|uniref:Glycosyltransferase family 4 protein n=1 Tax=Sinorhizobium numidicum TaxID=680248 RepID=A0ABY8CS63_9HYPH|nr:glycosyltransferase family 4 protein [Sinorhizobium numidicum]WEX75489.1 glycosyltransferase family 4 protein [Sinorhizobium numidicum]WEX81486.1 glycosyltransferase family 4 protein [Sinorhizobium numidicum]
MKIAQIAPLAERVPPKLYGGTERIVSYLTEELVRQGHDVTLFASGDSLTKAKLVPCSEVALRLNAAVSDPIPHLAAMIEEVRRHAQEFDVLHFHIEFLHFPLIRDFADRTVTTLHGRLDLPDLQPFYRAFPEIPVVSISNDQRQPMPPVNWRGTVYHGLDENVLPFTEKPHSGYLAFLGRISPEKGADRAIEIADRVGMRLKIAAKVDTQDKCYWQTVIEPMVASHPNVEYMGEIDEREKADFLGNAAAMLFPIDWPEPFGLVMIESMACGTPVLAFRCGSAPEVIDDGVSGILVDTMPEAIEKLEAVLSLDRRKVRGAFERRFTAERMTQDYLEIYRNLPGVCRQAAAAHAPEEESIALKVAW